MIHIDGALLYSLLVAVNQYDFTLQCRVRLHFLHKSEDFEIHQKLKCRSALSMIINIATLESLDSLLLICFLGI